MVSSETTTCGSTTSPSNKNLDPTTFTTRTSDIPWWTRLLGLESVVLTEIKQDLLERRDSILQVVAEIQDEQDQGLWEPLHEERSVTEEDDEEDATSVSTTLSSSGQSVSSLFSFCSSSSDGSTMNTTTATDEYLTELRDSCLNYSQACNLFAQLLARVQLQDYHDEYYSTDHWDS